MALSTQWLQGVHQAEHLKYKERVLSSKEVLDKLIEILYNKVQAQSSSSDNDYESPSWAYKQADKVGYTRALKEVIELCNVSDRETQK